MSIPFFDLKAQHASISAELDKAIERVFDSSNFIAGNIVNEFEKAFAKTIGVNNCISCANGTDSLEIILRAMNITKGDEVIVPAISWISTADAVSIVGAEPIFVDVDSRTGLIDVEKIPEAITSKTKAIMPVHLYGNSCDMNAIMTIAEQKNLFVIEDCAQAHLTEYHGRKAGTFGHAASFSFYPTKNLGAIGDAGAIVTNDNDLARRCKMMANHGQDMKHNFEFIGRNSRMDAIQASILLAKLPFLEKWTQRRIEIANIYMHLLSNADLSLPVHNSNKRHVFYLFVVQSEIRTDLIQKLNRADIGHSIHYPQPLPFLKPYSYKSHKPIDFSNAVSLCSQCLSLPLYPELGDNQIERICDTLLENL